MIQIPQYVYHFLIEYWPHIALILSLVISIPTAIHAAMNKQEVRAAIGWVGVIILSPFAGSILYFIAGVNRVRQTQISELRDKRVKEYVTDGSPLLSN